MKNFICLFLAVFIFSACQSQINFDYTDSLVNQQKQFIIRFDVANGNIYVPVKKETKEVKKDLKLFKRHILKLSDSILVPLYKDTFMEGKVVRWKYDMRKIPNPDMVGKGTDKMIYLIARRYYKPQVGSFLRLVFENVPKNMDVGVNAEFLDKNLENASAFEGYLNKYATALDTAVTRDVSKLLDTTKAAAIDKKVDSAKTSLDSSVDTFKHNVDTVIQLMEDIEKILPKEPITVDANKNNTLKRNIREIVDNLKAIQIADTSKLGYYIDTLLTPLAKNMNNLLSVNSGAARIVDSLNDKLSEMRIKSEKLKESKTTLLDLVKRVQDLEKQRDSLRKNYDSAFLVLYDSIYRRRTIYIQPIQIPNNDITLLKITYKTAGSPEKDVYREIMLKNKYGFKLDFSTGFIGTWLKDENYRLVPTPNTVSDTATIIEDAKGDFTIGFALLAHAYMRTGGRINIAINSGIMLNSSNQTINYLLGFSLPLGLEQRFIFSGGWTFGKVKRLTSGFEKNTPYPSSILNLSSGVPYTEKWKSSLYFGVSYNLSSLTASSRKTVIAR